MEGVVYTGAVALQTAKPVKTPWGVKTITNNHSIVVYDMDDETIEVGLCVVGSGYGKPSKHKLYITNKGVYFSFKGVRHYTSEFMRI